MRWLFVGACAAGLLAGCEGKKAVDPRLCPICRELAEIDADPSAKAKGRRHLLRESRSRHWEMEALNSPPAPPPDVECPDCSATYREILNANAAQMREFSKGR